MYQEPLLLSQKQVLTAGDQVPDKSTPVDLNEQSFLQVIDVLETVPVPVAIECSAAVRVVCSCQLGVAAGLEDGAVVLIRPNAEKELGRHLQGVLSICATGNLVISGGSDGTIKVWSLEEMKETTTLVESEPVKWLCVTKDLLVSSHGTYLKAWNLGTMNEVATVKSDSNFSALSIALSGQFVVGSVENGLKVWNVSEKGELVSLQGHTQEITCFAITPDGTKAISASEDHTVLLWSLTQMQLIKMLQDSDGYEIMSLAIAADGHYLLLGTDHSSLRLWDLNNLQELAHLPGHHNPVISIIFLNDHRVISKDWSGGVKVWSLEENKLMTTVRECGLLRDTTQLCVAFDGEWAVSALPDNKKSLQIWDLDEKKDIVAFEGVGNRAINVLCATPDGKHVISASSDMTVRIWSVPNMKLEKTLLGHTDSVYGLSLLPDGKHVISGALDSTLKMWDLEQGVEVGSINDLGTVHAVSTTEDGKFMVSALNTSKLVVRSVFNSEVKMRLLGHSNWVECVAVALNGEVVVSGSGDCTVRVWTLEKSVAKLEGHTSFVNCVAITPDARLTVSASEDNTLKVWSLIEMKEIATLRGHTGSVRSLAITSDGHYAISGAGDNTVKVWDLYEMRLEASIKTEFTCWSLTMANNGLHAFMGYRVNTLRRLNLRSLIPSLRTDYIQKLSHECASIEKVYYFFGEVITNVRTGVPICLEIANRLIWPYCFNSLHICAHYNYFTQLRDYLSQEVTLVRGVFGSPLTIALNRKTWKCIDVILQYLTDQKTDLVYAAFREVTDDLPDAIRSNSPALVPFLNSIFKSSRQSALPRFIVPLNPLPNIVFSSIYTVDLTDFAKFKGLKLDEVGAELAEFQVCLFWWNFTAGSASSLNFLRALEDCEDRSILTTFLAESVIESKWRLFMPFNVFQTVLYTCLLVNLMLLVMGDTGYLCLVFIGLNLLFLLYEGFQIIGNGYEYCSDPWNSIDTVRGLSSLIWAWLLYTGTDYEYFCLFVVFICFLRGFTYFRTFKITRMFVRMVLMVATEIYAFMIILAYTTLSFGMMFLVLDPNITDAASAWQSLYGMLLGNFSTEESGEIEWLCYLTASLINVIVMLNLLVSILGDAYGKAQEVARENDLLEMLQVVIEYESMLFWRRNAGKPTVLIQCNTPSEPSQDKEEEKVTRILQAMEKSQSGLEAKVTVVEKKLESRLNELETSLGAKLAAVEVSMALKIDQVLTALQASH